MSLTSYRAAPPRAKHTTSDGRGRDAHNPTDSKELAKLVICYDDIHVAGRPGSDLLSRALRQSTIGATGFHGRVRNGIGWDTCAITTWSSRHMKRTSRANKGAGSAKKRRHPKPVSRPFGQPYPALYYKVVYLVFACKIPQIRANTGWHLPLRTADQAYRTISTN